MTALAAVRRSKAERNRLVETNQGLVRMVVLKLKTDGWLVDMLPDDAIGWGQFGLIRAAELYDETRINPSTGQPYQFSTYATRTIWYTIRRRLSADRLVRVPCHAYSQGKRGPLVRRLGHRDNCDLSSVPVVNHGADKCDAGTNLIALCRHWLPAPWRVVFDRHIMGGDTLAAVGVEMGLTRERVRQIKKKILAFLLVKLEGEQKALGIGG